jgi:hypothetical protein
MKCRSGFVSNSSSSSFILALPKKPESANELWEMIKNTSRNNNTEWYDKMPSWLDFEYDENDKPIMKEDSSYLDKPRLMPITDLMGIVVSDLKQQATIEEIIEELRGYCVDIYSHPMPEDIAEGLGLDYYGASYQKLEPVYELYAQATYWWGHFQATRFITNNPNSVFYIVEYADNDGFVGSVLEHGGLLEMLSHIKISKH